MNTGLVAKDHEAFIPAILKIVSEAEAQIGELVGSPVRIVLKMPVTEVNLLTIQQQVCEVFDISWKEIESKKRDHPICNARHVYCYIATNVLGMTRANVGKTINRDHTTVIHSLRTVQDLIATEDQEIMPAIQRLNSILNIYQPAATA